MLIQWKCPHCEREHGIITDTKNEAMLCPCNGCGENVLIDMFEGTVYQLIPIEEDVEDEP